MPQATRRWITEKVKSLRESDVLPFHDILDAASGAVLDSRTLNAFQDGAYLTWDITRSVKVCVTNLGGVNAVLSGVFLDAVG
jgi:hypothetical protein